MAVWMENEKTGDDPAGRARDLDAIGMACVGNGGLPWSASGRTHKGRGPGTCKALDRSTIGLVVDRRMAASRHLRTLA